MRSRGCVGIAGPSLERGVVLLYWWIYALIGGFGAIALDGADIALYIQRNGHTPWKSRDTRGKKNRSGRILPRFPIFALALFLKSCVGMLVVGSLAAGQQLASPLTALVLGAGSANLIRRYAEQIPLPTGEVTIDLPPDIKVSTNGSDVTSSTETSPL
jgi:hypothetical protein